MRTAATGRKLNLQSDARYRFERGLDPEFVRRRASRSRPGSSSSSAAARRARSRNRRRGARTGGGSIRFRPERTRSLGGLEVPARPSSGASSRRSAAPSPSEATHWTVEPPSWRGDIEGEADLVEEVLRIHGYDNIPAVPLLRERRAAEAGARRRRSAAPLRAPQPRRARPGRGRDLLLPADAQAALFGGGAERCVSSIPISADLDAMRPSLLPNLLAAAQRNADRGFADGALFEIGPQYRDDTPEGQDLMAAGVRSGRTGAKRWDDPGRPVDAFLAKADAMAALAAAGVAAESVQVDSRSARLVSPRPRRRLAARPQALGAGSARSIPRVLAALDVKGPIGGLRGFPRCRAVAARPRPAAPGRFSSSRRSSRSSAISPSWWTQRSAGRDLLRAARSVDKKLVAEVRLFDVYAGAGLPEGKKSLAITVVLQPEEATLTDAALEGFSQKLVAAVEKATGGSLRS